MFGGLLYRKRKKNLAVTGSRGTIAIPSLGVNAILADLILAV